MTIIYGLFEVILLGSGSADGTVETVEAAPHARVVAQTRSGKGDALVTSDKLMPLRIGHCLPPSKGTVGSNERRMRSR